MERNARAQADVRATLNRLLDAGWTVIHGDGTINTKAEYLADLKSGARKFFADVSRRLHGQDLRRHRVAAGTATRKWRRRDRPAARCASRASTSSATDAGS